MAKNNVNVQENLTKIKGDINITFRFHFSALGKLNYIYKNYIIKIIYMKKKM